MKNWLTMGILCFSLTVSGNDEILSSWYVKGTFGLNQTGDENHFLQTATGSESAEASYDSGFAGGGSVGYLFSKRFRMELEMM